jgi:hypothetical protein
MTSPFQLPLRALLPPPWPLVLRVLPKDTQCHRENSFEATCKPLEIAQNTRVSHTGRGLLCVHAPWQIPPPPPPPLLPPPPPPPRKLQPFEGFQCVPEQEAIQILSCHESAHYPKVHTITLLLVCRRHCKPCREHILVTVHFLAPCCCLGNVGAVTTEGVELPRCQA